MRIPLAVNSYQSRSLPLSAQRLVNLYPETAPVDAAAQIALFGTPGLLEFANVGDGPIRGAGVMKRMAYVVSGRGVYKVDSDGVGTLIGTLQTSTGIAYVATNGVQIIIVTPSDGKGYTSDGETVEEITDPGFQGATSVAVIDGYAIYTAPDSGQFQISAILDASLFDPLEYATAEGAPDNLVRGFADHRELWLFGEETIEVWWNAGNADFPFSRISGAFIERGCIAPASVAKADNSVIWLGDDKIVYRANGYSPQRLSTHAIEYQIAKFSGDLSKARGFTYTQEGHTFYCLVLEAACFVLDLASGFWHERESYGLDRWRASCHMNCYTKDLVGDYASGKIYQLDLDTYTDDGGVLQKSATSAPIHADRATVFLDKCELEIESGAGLTTGQGDDPQAMLQWSDDGGRTFSNELWTYMGKIGEYRRRALWTSLGCFEQRIFRVTISDPIKTVIIALDAQTEV